MSSELRSTTRTLQQRSKDKVRSESEVSDLDLTWDCATDDKAAEAFKAVRAVKSESSGSQIDTDTG
jgi:hypothetical protein